MSLDPIQRAIAFLCRISRFCNSTGDSFAVDRLGSIVLVGAIAPALGLPPAVGVLCIVLTALVSLLVLAP